jgi:hypothetical protein
MANIWFRLHHDLLDDPRVQKLPADVFKTYINCLCLASKKGKDGTIGTIEDVSFALRETKEVFHERFMALQEVGLIVSSATNSETFLVPQWKKKQYKSDTSTERVRRHRNANKTVTETLVKHPDTDTDTDTDTYTDIEKGLAIIPPEKKKRAKNFVPPTIIEVIGYCNERDNFVDAEKFINFYDSKGWMIGKNKMKDWKAAVRTWEQKSKQEAGDQNRKTGTATPQDVDQLINDRMNRDWAK